MSASGHTASLQELYTLRFLSTECSESCGSSKYSLPHSLAGITDSATTAVVNYSASATNRSTWASSK
jgi:hypothetical protein